MSSVSNREGIRMPEQPADVSFARGFGDVSSFVCSSERAICQRIGFVCGYFKFKFCSYCWLGLFWIITSSICSNFLSVWFYFCRACVCIVYLRLHEWIAFDGGWNLSELRNSGIVKTSSSALNNAFDKSARIWEKLSAKGDNEAAVRSVSPSSLFLYGANLTLINSRVSLPLRYATQQFLLKLNLRSEEELALETSGSSFFKDSVTYRARKAILKTMIRLICSEKSCFSKYVSCIRRGKRTAKF